MGRFSKCVGYRALFHCRAMKFGVSLEILFSDMRASLAPFGGWIRQEGRLGQVQGSVPSTATSWSAFARVKDLRAPAEGAGCGKITTGGLSVINPCLLPGDRCLIQWYGLSRSHSFETEFIPSNWGCTGCVGWLETSKFSQESNNCVPRISGSAAAMTTPEAAGVWLWRALNQL